MITRVVIADDEPLARSKLRNFIARMRSLRLVGEFSNGDDALESVRDLRPEVIILDVRMPGTSGVEVARKLPEGTKILFTTAHAEYAVPAFELSAADYLLKPFSIERFRSAMQRAIEQLKKDRALDLLAQRVAAIPVSDVSSERHGPSTRLLLRTGNGIAVEEVSDVVSAEAQRNYVSIVTSANRYFVRGTLQELVKLLSGPFFVRVHRSRIVNIRFVKQAVRVARGRYRLVFHTGRSMVTNQNSKAAVETALGLCSGPAFGAGE